MLWHATNLPAIAQQRFDSRKTSRMQKYLAAAAANVSRYTLYMCMANLLSIAEHEESVSEGERERVRKRESVCVILVIT